MVDRKLNELCINNFSEKDINLLFDTFNSQLEGDSFYDYFAKNSVLPSQEFLGNLSEFSKLDLLLKDCILLTNCYKFERKKWLVVSLKDGTRFNDCNNYYNKVFLIYCRMLQIFLKIDRSYSESNYIKFETFYDVFTLFSTKYHFCLVS